MVEASLYFFLLYSLPPEYMLHLPQMMRAEGLLNEHFKLSASLPNRQWSTGQPTCFYVGKSWPCIFGKWCALSITGFTACLLFVMPRPPLHYTWSRAPLRRIRIYRWRNYSHCDVIKARDFKVFSSPTLGLRYGQVWFHMHSGINIYIQNLNLAGCVMVLLTVMLLYSPDRY